MMEFAETKNVQIHSYDLPKDSLFASGKSLAVVLLLVTTGPKGWCRISIASYFMSSWWGEASAISVIYLISTYVDTFLDLCCILLMGVFIPAPITDI